jgi:dephospho-CoA kinase
MAYSVIAIAGLPGSGKTTVSNYLHKKGYAVVYMGKVTKRIITEGMLDDSEENEKYIRDNLRVKYGKSVYAKLIISEIQEKLGKGNKVIIEGIRSIEELDYLKNCFAMIRVFYISAKDKLRYKRLAVREIRPLSYDQAISRDKDELNVLGLSNLKGKADIILDNSSTKNNLYLELDKIL